MIRIVNRAIVLEEMLDSLKSDESGSVVMHMGIVRPSKKLASIEYQSEKEEAEKELSHIVRDVKDKWEIQDIALCRRMGKLNPEEIILVSAVSAPHRREAFEACQYAVEQLRGMTSVKKREIYEE